MLAVFLGHQGLREINPLLYSFHLPLFYYIAGYFFHADEPLPSMACKKARALLIPYATTCVLMVCGSLLISKNFDTALGWLYASLYGSGGACTPPFHIHMIGATWFLLSIFGGYLLLSAVTRIHSFIWQALAVCLLFAASCLSARLIWLPLSIQTVGPALLFMYMGYLFQLHGAVALRLKPAAKYAICIALLLCWVANICLFRGFYLVDCTINNGLLDILGSLGGFIAVAIVSRLICNPLLNFIGRFSLLFLCLHNFEHNLIPWQLVSGKILVTLSLPLELQPELTIALRLAFILAGSWIIAKTPHLKILFGYKNTRGALPAGR